MKKTIILSVFNLLISNTAIFAQADIQLKRGAKSKVAPQAGVNLSDLFQTVEVTKLEGDIDNSDAVRKASKGKIVIKRERIEIRGSFIMNSEKNPDYFVTDNSGGNSKVPRAIFSNRQYLGSIMTEDRGAKTGSIRDIIERPGQTIHIFQNSKGELQYLSRDKNSFTTLNIKSADDEKKFREKIKKVAGAKNGDILKPEYLYTLKNNGFNLLRAKLSEAQQSRRINLRK